LCKASDGRIIIYGGSKVIGKLMNVKVTPDLVVLNSQTIIFEWTAPNIFSNIGEVLSLTVHTAN